MQGMFFVIQNVFNSEQCIFSTWENDLTFHCEEASQLDDNNQEAEGEQDSNQNESGCHGFI